MHSPPPHLDIQIAKLWGILFMRTLPAPLFLSKSHLLQHDARCGIFCLYYSGVWRNSHLISSHVCSIGEIGQDFRSGKHVGSVHVVKSSVWEKWPGIVLLQQHACETNTKGLTTTKNLRRRTAPLANHRQCSQALFTV